MGVIFKNNVMYGAGDIEISPVCYSEEEREVGCWVDGKPLYEKTVIWDNPTLGRVDNLPHGLENVEHIHMTNWQFGSVFGFESTDTSWWANIFNVTNTGVSYRIGGSWGNSAKPLIITFQYTKTTDTPGSGTWTPSGVPAVHYSTDEHVVGTWTDGSTLYEKVIDFGSLPNNTEKSVAHGISNANKIWIADGYVTTGSAFYELDHSTNTFANNWSSNVDTTNVTIETYTNRSALSAIVILRYTKSTS